MHRNQTMVLLLIIFVGASALFSCQESDVSVKIPFQQEVEKPMYLPEIRDFSMLKFCEDQDEFFWLQFATDVILGEMNDPATLVQKVEEIWVSIYGEKIKETKRPYQLYFDESCNVWYVRGTLEEAPPGYYMMGGVPEILVQKTDGKVLAVWHSA